MATKLYFRNSKTYLRAYPQTGYYDMTTANPVQAQGHADAATTGDVERNFPTAQGFWSERIDDATVIIAGAITGAVRLNTTSGTTKYNGRLRMRVYKITTGGSDVESLIAEGDASASIVLNVETTYAFSFTPAAPVTLTRNERIIARVVIVAEGGPFDTDGTPFLTAFGGGGTAYSFVQFTETFTTRPNVTTLILRSSAANGIGNFFDLLETRTTGAVQSGVVNTVASGTEIQWTRTAGGTPLEWISQRLQSGWTVNTIAAFGSLVMYAFESNTAANCSFRCKMFARSSAGFETLIATWTYTGSTELGLTAVTITLLNSHGVLNQATTLVEDDRLVFRAYIIPAAGTTMGGARTCTISYDQPNALSSGDARIPIIDTPEFKAESDPAGTSSIPGGMTMGGVGN